MKKINYILGVALSLITATGVFVHDARIDKVTTLGNEMYVKRSLASNDSGMVAEPHVHPESTQRTLNGFAYQSPSIQPKEKKSKRYLIQNIEAQGRHLFDNDYLPVIT